MLDRGSFGPDVDLSAIEASLPSWRCYDSSNAPQEVAARIREAGVVVTNKARIDGAHIEQARELRLICVAATGLNNVDIETAARRGVAVCNVRGYATASVTQHVFALMLALGTRLIDYRDAVRSGRWQQSAQFCLLDYPIIELAGRTLGIVGFGELGRSVAQRAAAFGMDVMIAARPGAPAPADRVPFEELLERVDVLSLHCPLTPETRGLIGRRELAAMKREALLINTARGGIVDEEALAAALRQGLIAGAGVDVLTLEPPRQGNPLLADDIPNLIVTPHIAWASREARQRLLAEVGMNIAGFLAGRPRNLVMPASNL